MPPLLPMAENADTFRVSGDEIASKVIDGEAVIINLSNGVYYSLDGTGAFVWAMLHNGHPVDAVARELAARHRTELDRAQADVQRLVEELQREGLVVVADGVTPRPLEMDFPRADGYAPPRLEKYSDMGDLLALDPPMPGIQDIPWKAPAS